MIFEQIAADGDRNFAYLVGDEASGAAAIIDPSLAPGRCVQQARQHGLSVKYIISTHSHKDHVAGNAEAMALTGAKDVLHASSPHPSMVRVEDDELLHVGGLKLRFLHTPGHIPDHVCILVEGHLITGDILFVGKVGGTGPYFQGSDPRQQWESLQRLMKLDPQTSVWPGHDYGVRPSSSIGEEIATNPFLKCPGFEDFMYLKEHWAEYKKLHNIV